MIRFIFNGAHKEVGEQRTKKRSHCDAISLLVKISIELKELVLVAALSSSISWSLDRFSSWVVLNQLSWKALSAKIWIVSFSGTLVNKEVTS